MLKPHTKTGIKDLCDDIPQDSYSVLHLLPHLLPLLLTARAGAGKCRGGGGQKGEAPSIPLWCSHHPPPTLGIAWDLCPTHPPILILLIAIMSTHCDTIQ